MRLVSQCRDFRIHPRTVSPRYQAPGGGARLKADSKLQAGDGGQQAWGKPGVPQELMSLSSQWWSGRKPCDVGNACSSGQTGPLGKSGKNRSGNMCILQALTEAWGSKNCRPNA